MSTAPGGVQRSLVLWLGPAPDDNVRRELRHRDLQVEVVAAGDACERLRFARALVAVFDPAAPDAAIAVLRALAASALDHGLQLWALAPDDAALAHLAEGWTRLKHYARTRVTLRAAPPPHEIPERIARWDPGPAEAPALAIEWESEADGSAQTEDPRAALLFRRAFHDCRSIAVQRLDGGRSARVFRVHAVLDNSLVGPRPLPFFAKFDAPHKILRERENYALYVAGFVPFNLRPNLDERRCLVGATRGLLVGNFVERSESLWEVARRGTGQAALHSLFERALQGWSLQAYTGLPVERPVLAELLGGPRREVSDERLSAARALGLQRAPTELLAALQALPMTPHRVGPMHGDLHAHNVQVRDGDATLIDFYSTRIGPLVADSASLEVSLAFQAYGGPGGGDAEGWRAFVDRLYQPAHLAACPPPLATPDPRGWLWDCVRHIRRVALASRTSPREYEAVLAFYLFRRATFATESRLPGDGDRRAYALLIAERILEAIGAPPPGGAA